MIFKSITNLLVIVTPQSMGSAMDKAKPLSSFGCGVTVKVAGYDGSHSCRCRLCALGLTPGASVEVRGAGGHGCLVRVRGCDLHLSDSLACCVLAE